MGAKELRSAPDRHEVGQNFAFLSAGDEIRGKEVDRQFPAIHWNTPQGSKRRYISVRLLIRLRRCYLTYFVSAWGIVRLEPRISKDSFAFS